MPPKARTTREIILNTALEIAREAGFEPVNTRSISGRLQRPVRPISTCCESTEELRKEFLDFTYEFYGQYVESYSSMEHINPYLALPFLYIESAREEMNLSGLLSIDHMDLSTTEPEDFYMEAGSREREGVFSDTIGIEPERARAIFMDLFLYSHGIVALAAARKITLDRSHMEKTIANMLAALTRQERPGRTLSVSDITESI